MALPVTYDSLYGASFNNDGKLFAFGGADNRARIVRVADGKEMMRFDAHSDYVLGTTFSLKQDYLITVSRDMSMKLVVVENGQFVDNITSITPGALKGGLVVVERHPSREQVLTGGADGEPKLYQIFRTKTRVIGDDFNRIRGYEPLPGRIFSMQFNKDGSQFVVGASTATAGTARIYQHRRRQARSRSAQDLGTRLCRGFPTRRQASRRRRVRGESPPVRRRQRQAGQRIPAR